MARAVPATVSIPTTATNTTVKSASGTINRALVTTAGTGSGTPCLMYDSSSAASGTIVGLIPANAALGTAYVFNFPVQLGIVVAQVTSGPVFTLSYDDTY